MSKIFRVVAYLLGLPLANLKIAWGQYLKSLINLAYFGCKIFERCIIRNMFHVWQPKVCEGVIKVRSR